MASERYNWPDESRIIIIIPFISKCASFGFHVDFKNKNLDVARKVVTVLFKTT